jgi:hypothetical protein
VPARSRSAAQTDSLVLVASGSAQLREEPTLLSVEHLVVEYGADAYRVQVVSDVSSLLSG